MIFGKFYIGPENKKCNQSTVFFFEENWLKKNDYFLNFKL